MNIYLVADHASSQADVARIASPPPVSHQPRHDLDLLSQRLGATFVWPQESQISMLDKMRSRIIGQPEIWSFARELASSVTHTDILFCPSEDIAIPVAAACKQGQKTAKIVAVFHNIDRPRGRIALNLFSAAKQIDLFLVHSYSQLNFLRRQAAIPADRVQLLPYSIDSSFFTPGSVSPDKSRPVIATVGLEKRDYRLLAAATADLDVDVKISGFSRYARETSSTFPEVTPSNMTRRFYEWDELVQLYRDADIVVVCLRENPYAAGITTLLEAMACKRPVIATRTEGLVDYLMDENSMLTVEPGDEAGLRSAIEYLLSHPEAAQQKAERAHQLFLDRYRLDSYIESLARSFAALQSEQAPLPVSRGA